MRTLASFLSILLLACGGGGGSSDQTTAPDPQVTTDPGPTTGAAGATTGAAGASPEAVAGTGEIRIYEGDELIIVIEPAGVVRVVQADNQVAGTIEADNSFTAAGRTAILRDDGVFVLDGEETPFTIGPDATLNRPGLPPATIEADGSVVGQELASRPLRVEGADTPELRRKAMFLLLFDHILDQEGADGEAAPAESAGDEGKTGGPGKKKMKEARPPPTPPAGDGAVDDM
jgi:hypothetical protein